jgi:preprotein translocase subunit SecD
VKGFAITLIIGLVANVFTAFAVTRLIVDFLLSKKTITTLSI